MITRTTAAGISKSTILSSRRSLTTTTLARVLVIAGAAGLGACATGDTTDEPLGVDDQLLTAEALSAPAPSSVVPKVDPARSLMVTDPVVLAHFPLQSVLTQIISKAHVGRPDPLDLYRRWWDSQNTKAQGLFPDAIHCDDQVDGKGNPGINGFPIQCPRNEGALAKSNPFLDDPANGDFMKPVAIVNRFDLTPLDGSNCGEYRIIYAKRSGETDIFNRNLIILEGQLPNPDPSRGIAACRPVAEFWANLTDVAVPDARAVAIKKFYFKGLPGFKPVIDPANYGLVARDGSRHGQIRSNQFMPGPNTQIWQLREFQLDRVCHGDRAVDCRLAVEPVTVKENPFGALFNVNFGDPRAANFQSDFISQVAPLAPQDTNGLVMHTDDTFNAGQSNSQAAENDYGASLTQSGPVSSFTQAIDAELANIARSDLSALNLADRATTQSCGGCHQLSSGDLLGGTQSGSPLRWPAHPSEFVFVHVTETSELSKPLIESFLPHRKRVLEDYLASKPLGSPIASGPRAAITDPMANGRTVVRTLGGSVTH
jgi:hypothetical protein